MAITLRLTNEQAKGLNELIRSAQRGHEAFLQDSQYGDFTQEEIQTEGASWELAKRSAQTMLEQLSSETDDPLTEAVEEFATLTVGWVEDDIWGKASCCEAEAAARIYTLMGMPELAEMVIVVHTESDYEEDEEHSEYFGLSRDAKHALYKMKHPQT